MVITLIPSGLFFYHPEHIQKKKKKKRMLVVSMKNNYRDKTKKHNGRDKIKKQITKLSYYPLYHSVPLSYACFV